jgi:hypothetical protein
LSDITSQTPFSDTLVLPPVGTWQLSFIFVTNFMEECP